MAIRAKQANAGHFKESELGWGIHPEDLVTHRFTLDEVSKAYELMDEGKCGKVAVVFDEEVK